jgi:VanZ family protein
MTRGGPPHPSDTMPGVGRVASTWLPPLVWMAIIFAFSARHGGGHLPAAEIVLRKLGHVTGYLILTLFGVRALRRSGVASAVPVAAAAALAYAASDEWHQSFVPGRTATPRDVAIDAVGIALAAVAVTRTRVRAAVA